MLAAGVHILHAFAVAPQETTERELPAPLVQTEAIALPGVEGRIDHLTADVARERLYVAALGNDSVEVVDLAAGRHSRSLRGPGEPTGILYLADYDRMVVACRRTGTCEVFDGGTLEKVASVRALPLANSTSTAVRYICALLWPAPGTVSRVQSHEIERSFANACAAARKFCPRASRWGP